MLEEFVQSLKTRNPDEPEFHQAIAEVASSVMPWYEEQETIHPAHVFERMTESDRIIVFRIAWEDDNGEIQVNRGWRVQFSHILGSCKGGLRFSPDSTQAL